MPRLFRAVWVDTGNDPDWDKVAKYEMTHLFFDLFDPRLTPTYLRSVETRGYGTGLYVAANWPQVSGTGIEFAEKVHKRLEVVDPGLDRAQPKVQLDIEQHDPAYILNALERWRRLRPKRDTSWTMESLQGGWMSPEFVAGVLACRVRIVPQYYKGDMGPMAMDVGLKEMLKAGFPAHLVTGFYDAAVMPLPGWTGWAFSMGRLP